MTFSRHAVAAGGVGLGLAIAAVVTLAPAVLAAGPLAISIVDTSFQPTNLTVNVGDTVTWTVTKAISAPHSVTSGTGPSDPNTGKVFDSGITLKDNGQTYAFKFDTPGTYPFYCQVHPTTMSGTITVGGGAGASGAPPPSAAPAASGAPAANEAPAGSGGPAGSGAPGPSVAPAPPGSERDAIPPSDKAIAAGILGAALVILFGSAVLYRRVNRP
jgi:plastocyanin